MSRRRLYTLPESSLPPNWRTPRRPAPTYPEYAQLRADAEASARADGGFVDPGKVRRWQQMGRPWEWRVSVLGHDRTESLVELHMLLLAADRGLMPPPQQWFADILAAGEERDAARAAQRKARDDKDETVSQAALAEFPVGVTVLRNGTGRVRYGFVHHLGHIVPKADVLSGSEQRPRRHRAGRGLCETENRGKPLDLSGGEGGPATCERCLMWAAKVRAAA